MSSDEKPQDLDEKPRRYFRKRVQQRPSDLDVGYGRPPVHTRFKPGVSGNPKGRPKTFKPRNLLRDLQEVYLKEIPVKDGNSRVRMSRVVLLHETLLREALKGNARSASLAVKLAGELGVMHVKDEVGMDLSKLTSDEKEQIDKAFHLLRKAQILK